MQYFAQLLSFKIFMDQHLLEYNAYCIHFVGLGDGSAKASNEQVLFPALPEFTILWGRQISAEIIQKGKKGHDKQWVWGLRMEVANKNF